MFASPCPGRCPLSTSEYFSNSHFVILIPPPQVTEFYADSNTKVSELFILNIRQEDTGNYFCRWTFCSVLWKWKLCKIVGIVDNLNCYVSSWNSPFSTHPPASISTKLPKRTIIGMFRSLSNLYKNSWKCFSGKNAAGAARANFTITVFKRWFFNIYHSGSRRRQCQLAFVPWWCSLLLLESCFLGYQTELPLHTNSYIYLYI